MGQVLATLDCIFALATAAVSAPIPYVRPKLLEQGSGVIKLQEIRHPCLELQDDVSFIPNDCTFDKGLTCTVLMMYNSLMTLLTYDLDIE